MLDLDDFRADDTIEPLSVGLLHFLSCHKVQDDGGCGKTSLIDRRYQDIISCISKNLTNPDLTSHRVAGMCGISPRHLCKVLRSKHTTYSQIVWRLRLQQARIWLADPSLREHGVQEIAYMAGFKSCTHFSRAFKAIYGLTPKSCRQNLQ